MSKVQSTVQHSGHLGEHLKKLRKARGLSQRGLALRAGLSPQTVSLLESDPSQDPRLSTLLRIQRGLDLASIEQLLGGTLSFASDDLARQFLDSDRG